MARPFPEEMLPNQLFRSANVSPWHVTRVELPERDAMGFDPTAALASPRIEAAPIHRLRRSEGFRLDISEQLSFPSPGYCSSNSPRAKKPSTGSSRTMPVSYRRRVRLRIVFTRSGTRVESTRRLPVCFLGPLYRPKYVPSPGPSIDDQF